MAAPSPATARSFQPLLVLPLTPQLDRVRFLSPVSFPRFDERRSKIDLLLSRRYRPRFSTVVTAAQSNLFKVFQTAWRVGKDVTEAGTNLIPDAVPRPVARIGVASAAVIFALFLLKSFLSTALFVLAMMGLIYFVFVAFNTKEVSGTTGATTKSEDEALEEARRIMEKYK